MAKFIAIDANGDRVCMNGCYTFVTSAAAELAAMHWVVEHGPNATPVTIYKAVREVESAPVIRDVDPSK